ncbi:uncharacterized protein ACLA_042130 [Aspergillus clavatus NRRL 1]|uniref:Uncharacterized protein n=1 Tax=Aspergillus clavatus (strain ATCC 1007 / CBS 513.65 / DSM 816 / NCTC 3887 / NRRL 1 / QM 1276 / 107) TaxID=344612 RepID=A1CLG7_ASPCL|nr:uncharacterized protein ACLA_042130 [Aspergillus clavatus NRRL 1]EAW09991.1 conserved hypothetical protein [Aspergillus clavatus NRRL 1]
MDKLTSFASKFAGSESNQDSAPVQNQAQNQPQGQNQNQNQNQAVAEEDYLDRGLDALERKFGGGKVDPVKMRATNEKITDGVRAQFEKATGYKVPEKFSN